MTAHYRQIPLSGFAPRHFRANSRESELTFCTTFCQCEVRRGSATSSSRSRRSCQRSSWRAYSMGSGSQGRPEAGAADPWRPRRGFAWGPTMEWAGRCGARPGCIRGRPVRHLYGWSATWT